VRRQRPPHYTKITQLGDIYEEAEGTAVFGEFGLYHGASPALAQDDNLTQAAPDNSQKSS
jgi:hypothetical protein